MYSMVAAPWLRALRGALLAIAFTYCCVYRLIGLLFVACPAWYAICYHMHWRYPW